MNVAENIPEAISLIRSLGDGCLLVAFVGCVFMLVASACVLGFPELETVAPATQPPVTVLKPLHGAEPGLPARLAAFCRQEYSAPVQILCGAQDHASPVVAAVRGLKADFPDTAIELAVNQRSHGVNRKMQEKFSGICLGFSVCRRFCCYYYRCFIRC